MSSLPPPPINEAPGSFVWLEWYKLLRNYITVNGSVPWNIINFAGSNLADLATKSHLSLQGVQGGSSSEQYHLTAAEYGNLTASATVTTVNANTALDDTIKTVYVTTSGKTITLPQASTTRIGKDWVVILGVTGNVTITPYGTDTIVLPTNDTSVVLDTKGSSVTLKCLNTSTWGIV